MVCNPYIHVLGVNRDISPGEAWDPAEFEGFAFSHDGSVRTLLPEEGILFENQIEEYHVYIASKATASCVAGAGQVALKNNILLGGWCSFSCRLISPRRFAVRCRTEILQKQAGDAILTIRMRGVLRDAFEQTAKELVNPSDFKVRAYVTALFLKKAKRALLDIGWLITSCRLENIELSKGL